MSRDPKTALTVKDLKMIIEGKPDNQPLMVQLNYEAGPHKGLHECVYVYDIEETLLRVLNETQVYLHVKVE